MDRRVKIIGTIIGVLLFVLLIAGVTYAYFTWTSENVNRKVSSKCFEVNYDKGTDISGVIIPSYDYTGGLIASVKMNIDSSCDIRANGKLYLNTLEDTSSNLYSDGLLNYQVVSGDVLLGSDSITSSGVIELDLGELSKSDSASTEYTIYVWVDNDVVDTSDIGSVYYGNIRAEAIQFR